METCAAAFSPGLPGLSGFRLRALAGVDGGALSGMGGIGAAGIGGDIGFAGKKFLSG
jgi:hypothetical protein